MATNSRLHRRCAALLAAAAVSLSPLTATAFAADAGIAAEDAERAADADQGAIGRALAEDDQDAPEITWEECPEQVDLPNARCGRIEVPTYYDSPEKGSISVGFVHVPAANPEAKRGTIFGNPGGPGIEAYSYFGNSAVDLPESIVNEYDRVAVQPRDLSGSTPVECTENDNANLLDAELRPGSFVRDNCEHSTPGYTASLTTENTAHDWDMVRRALGEDRISILGLSYGTYLGSVYATLFPEHTDKVVLDSAMSPNLAWNGVITAQEEGFRNALHDMFQFMADRDEEYHLGTTPLAVYEKWSRKVASEAGITPTVLPPNAQIGDLPPGLEFAGQPGADLISGSGELRVQADYLGHKALNPDASQANSFTLQAAQGVIPRPEQWDAYAKHVAGIEPLPNPDEQMADLPEEELEKYAEDTGRMQFMQNLLVCNENAVPANPLALPKYLWSGYVLEDPFTAAPAMWESGVNCYDRPATTAPIQVNGNKLATRPLQISGTDDPQTPYKYHGDLQQMMGAHLVTVHGPGHGHVGFGNEEVGKIVDEYLRTGHTDATDAPGFFG